MIELPDHGLMFDGHLDLDSEEFDGAITQATDWLVNAGMSRREATFRTQYRPELVQFAWYGDTDEETPHPNHEVRRGFVQEHHDDARPVTIIHVPVSSRPDPVIVPKTPPVEDETLQYSLTRFPEQS